MRDGVAIVYHTEKPRIRLCICNFKDPISSITMRDTYDERLGLTPKSPAPPIHCQSSDNFAQIPIYCFPRGVEKFKRKQKQNLFKNETPVVGFTVRDLPAFAQFVLPSMEKDQPNSVK